MRERRKSLFLLMSLSTCTEAAQRCSKSMLLLVLKEQRQKCHNTSAELRMSARSARERERAENTRTGGSEWSSQLTTLTSRQQSSKCTNSECVCTHNSISMPITLQMCACHVMLVGHTVEVLLHSIEGEKCPAFHTRAPSGYSQYTDNI